MKHQEHTHAQSCSRFAVLRGEIFVKMALHLLDQPSDRPGLLVGMLQRLRFPSSVVQKVN